jgi:hypothetical protein
MGWLLAFSRPTGAEIDILFLIEVVVMAVKIIKLKRKTERDDAKGKKRTKAQEEADFESRLTRIINNPDSPQIAKAMAALRLKRDKSGEPYLTIEQIMAELERN